MNDVPQVSTADAVLLVGLLSAISKATTDADKQARTVIAADYLSEGDRVTIRHPETRAKLGTVSVTEPKPVAEVEDEDALTAHAAEVLDNAVGTVEGVDLSQLDEVLDVLSTHAPHLISRTPMLATWARKQLLDQAATDGEPIPGVVVRMKRGHAAVRHEPGALDAYRALIAAGQLDPLRELPAAS